MYVKYSKVLKSHSSTHLKPCSYKAEKPNANTNFYHKSHNCIKISVIKHTQQFGLFILIDYFDLKDFILYDYFDFKDLEKFSHIRQYSITPLPMSVL